MTLMELQKLLGDELDALVSAQVQVEDAKAVALLAKQMINNADVILRADKYTKKDGARIDMIVGDKMERPTLQDLYPLYQDPERCDC